MKTGDSLYSALDGALEAVGRCAEQLPLEPQVREVGQIRRVGDGYAWVQGLPQVASEELLRFPGGKLGMAFDLRADGVGVVLLDDPRDIESGQSVRRTGRVLDVPVGEALLGRAVDAIGRPIDEAGRLRASERLPVERPAPPIVHRAAVEVPLQTGIKVVDALLPIGRGQRELIIGDRQTGKSALALDAVLNQRDGDVVCVYCAIGQRTSFVARLLADLDKYGARHRTLVVVAGGADTPGLQFLAPYAATSMAEYFRDQGRDVLIVYDDLTRHARAYRQLSLLLRRPPGREAYPGDIFYVHSRLLERSTRLRPEHGGGSLSALPIVETQAQNLSAYIPTNLISITDGQIYLSPELFQKGILPAVDVARSVSRVGGKAQRLSLRRLAASLRITYAQFEELEEFSRFETRLDASSRKILEHGRRLREILQQPQYVPMALGEQIVVLLAFTEGLLALPSGEMAQCETRLLGRVRSRHPDLLRILDSGGALTEAANEKLLATIRSALGPG